MVNDLWRFINPAKLWPNTVVFFCHDQKRFWPKQTKNGLIWSIGPNSLNVWPCHIIKREYMSVSLNDSSSTLKIELKTNKKHFQDPATNFDQGKKSQENFLSFQILLFFSHDDQKRMNFVLDQKKKKKKNLIAGSTCLSDWPWQND